MVKNPRTQTGTGTTHRPLNMPVPVTVQTGTKDSPAATDALRRRHTDSEKRTVYTQSPHWSARSHPESDSALARVANIIDMWEIDDEWWRTSPIRRRYWKIKLETGHDLTLFQDIESGKWFQQDY